MLRVRLDGGEMYAKQGSMVAYRGQMDFAYKGQGVGGFLRRAVSGEGQDLMRVRGRGIVWFAESGSHISVFHLDSDRLTVNGRNLLALESGLRYQITTTSGGVAAMGSKARTMPSPAANTVNGFPFTSASDGEDHVQ